MTISNLPLSYCTNVHPGVTLVAIDDGLDRFSRPIADRFGRPLAAGLWLADPVIRELNDPAALDRFAERLSLRGLTCHTLNAFPYGNFHSDRVKEQVYLPDWTSAARLDYTLACARVLSRLLPPNTEGSISTAPLGFKRLSTAPDFVDRCIDRLLECAVGLDRLRNETGRMMRLAIEPEPLCVLETTDETLAFFERLRHRAADRHLDSAANEHLGVCYDVCHQAVEFEDVAASIAALDAAGVRIAKVHVTCAIEAPEPGRRLDVRESLARYVEPRYLHQTFVPSGAGRRAVCEDLSTDVALDPNCDDASAALWRVHFHVPVDAEELGPLRTTRRDLQAALAATARLNYAPHLEVETYTWTVMPGQENPDLVSGIARELAATDRLLAPLR